MKAKITLLLSAEFAQAVEEVIVDLLHRLSTQILEAGQYGVGKQHKEIVLLCRHIGHNPLDESC